MAETEGFEPSIQCYPYNALAKRRLQPLGHVSLSAKHPYRRGHERMQATAGACDPHLPTGSFEPRQGHTAAVIGAQKWV